MLGRLVIFIGFIAMPSIGLASIEGAVTRGEAGPEASQAGAVESQATRTQLQGEKAAQQATPGSEPKMATSTTTKAEYQFQASAYLGFSIGPRNTYNGSPSSYKGFVTNFSAGAATMLTEKLYFAGEVFIDDNFHWRGRPNPKSLKTDWSYGLDVIPGYMVTKYVLGYVRIGVESTHFDAPKTSSTAWRLGVGAETNLCERWDIRGEYVFSGYKRIPVGKPQSDQFNLGIIYKFI